MYLYIFKNKSTEKKYFGYTTRPIEAYLGSGKYWKNHCKTNGGYNKQNIEKLWYQWFETKEYALDFIKDFEIKNPNYWESDEWANLVPETLEESPFKGNMEIIFKRNGNPFSGGEIQRKSHAEGCHNYDRSENARKGWLSRSKEEAANNMLEGYKVWMKENKEEFLANQREKSRKSALVTCKKILYNNELYYGWRDLQEKTGVSKHMFIKYELGIIL